MFASNIRVKLLNKIKYRIIFKYFKRISIVGIIYLVHSFLYTYIGNNHVNAKFNLLTDFDMLIPIIPEMVYFYLSYYVIVVISVFFINTEEAFIKIILSVISTILFTYPFFYFFPAYYKFPTFEANTFTYKVLLWCYSVDVPNNTFPSLHVSLSFTMALGINYYRKRLGIIYII